MNELGKIGNLFKKVDKDFADKIKSRLTLTDLLDPLSRAVAVLQDKHLLLDVVSKVKKLDLDQDFINNLISRTNFPGGVAGVIKAAGIFFGSTKGIINGLAEVNAGINEKSRFYKLLGFLDIVGAVAAFSMIMGFPQISFAVSSLIVPLKLALILSNSKEYSSIQKFDAVLSAIGHFSWMMVYFSMFMPFPMIISIANNLFQLIVMNNEKVRSKLSKFFENIKK